MHHMQVRGKSEVQIAARDAIGHMDYLRERLNSSQEAIEVCFCPAVLSRCTFSPGSHAMLPPVCRRRMRRRWCEHGMHQIQPPSTGSARRLSLAPQVGDEALQLALEEQREQCATLEARLATTQARKLFLTSTAGIERIIRAPCCQPRLTFCCQPWSRGGPYERRRAAPLVWEVGTAQRKAVVGMIGCCAGSQALLRARDQETQDEAAAVRAQLEEAHDQLEHFQQLAEDAQVGVLPCWTYGVSAH